MSEAQLDKTAGQATGASPAPPWIAAQLEALLNQRGHAWLLGGPSGLGQYRLALEMVRAWLCESPAGAGACGHCSSCHAIDVHTHADLCVLMPETIMLELGWPLGEKAQSDIDDKKRKASKEIRVDAMRDAVEFSQRTSARGRGKAVLVFPAERMNNITANALLKTLEEPPGDVKFVLATEAAHQLPPTIRSRCLGHTMVWPAGDASLAWLQAQGVDLAQARVLLHAAGGRPEDALAFLASGRDPASWAAFPKAMQQGRLDGLKDWTPVQTIDALHKLCHDMLALKTGAQPRFFEPANLPPVSAVNAVPAKAAGRSIPSIPSMPSMPSFASLTAWAQTLSSASRTMEHPFNSGLMMEALVSQAKNALNPKTP